MFWERRVKTRGIPKTELMIVTLLIHTHILAVVPGATLLGPAALAAPGDGAGCSGPYCTPFEHADMYHQLP